MGRRPLGRPFFCMKTYAPKPRDIERRWYVIDAGGAVLGRLSTEVAAILRGKHKPIFAPHMDAGDHVIVVNAQDVRLTGGKEDKKVAYRHSGYPGGIKATTYRRLLAERPVYAVEKAVRGMLPKNRLGRAMAKKLQVYAGPEHPHRAQKPRPLKLGEIPPWEGLPVRQEKAEAASPEPAKPTASGSSAGRTAASEPDSAAAPVAKRTTAKRTTANRAAATATSAAKKSPAKKSPAEKSPAKKSPAEKSPAEKSPAKKSTAKRPASRRTTKEE
jgi:large subunit ribosomal protein L13